MNQEKDVKDLTFNDLAKMARDEAEAFATFIIGEAPTYRNGREVRYFAHQSLVVFTSGNKKGRFKSFSDDQARGDLFDLWGYIRGGTPHDAVVGYKSFAGIDTSSPNATVSINRGPSKEEIQRQEEEDIRKRIAKAQWIWNGSSKTDGREEGLAYLGNRSITTIPEDDTIRFRRLDRKSLEKMGVKPEEIPDTPVVAIVFKATNQAGEITAVQQILTTQGRKLKCDNPKRTNGSLTGSSVMLGSPSQEGKMLMAEGPETALSIFQSTGIPTKITLGTSNYTNIAIPDWVSSLIIATDMDESGVGLASSLKAAQHWSRNGVENVGIALPRIRVGDYNDVHQSKGEQAVAKSIESAFFPDMIRDDEVVLATPDARVAFHAWLRTGVSTAIRIPPLNKATGKRSPINLDSLVDEKHKMVFIVEKEGFQFDLDYVEKNRPEVELIKVSDEAAAFLEKAKDPDYPRRIIESADIYAPQGKGDKGAIAVTLRRKDADALISAGHKAIAIRPTQVEQVDLNFLKGRTAILAPVGKGTDADARLKAQLEGAGADVKRLTWQIFKPTSKGLEIVRSDIPKSYGAAEAVAEGWKGPAMRDLLRISDLNAAQISQVEKPAPRKSDALEL